MNQTLRITALLLVAGMLASCKLVNTHTFKVTGAAQIDGTGARLDTTQGRLLLSAQSLNEKQIELLKGLRPFQCLSVRTSEPYDMNNRTVQFREFTLRKLVDGDSECRKIRTPTRITVQ